MDRLLTVLVQTSPIPSHPSTALLEALFRSFDRIDGLRECNICIICDGCDEVSEEEEGFKRGKVSAEAAARYREHLELLRSRLGQAPFHSSKKGSVELMELKERHGSARAIAAAFEANKVQTPCVMIAQHDNLFVRDVPLKSVLAAIQQAPFVKSLHFVSTATIDYIKKAKLRYGLKLLPRSVDGLEWPLVPLAFWYGRTQVARTEYYTDFVLNRTLQVGDHLEELLGEKQLKDMISQGPEVAHELFGNYVLDQGREVLYHLSGRRARATSTSSENMGVNSLREGADDYERIPDEECARAQLPASAPHNENSGSYTTARSCRAVVPGLEFLPARHNSSDTKPRGRFRQHCFRCGVKGHSYKWCPNAKELPKTEIIDLS